MKVLHYLNQFFAGIGGEEKAGQEVLFIPRAVGVGSAIENNLKDRGIEYATLACGDNYFHEEEEKALTSRRPGLQCRQIRPGLCQGLQLGARQLAHTRRHRNARRQSGNQGDRPACLCYSNWRLRGFNARKPKALFAPHRGAARSRRKCHRKFPS